jgi:hypothetical protein
MEHEDELAMFIHNMKQQQFEQGMRKDINDTNSISLLTCHIEYMLHSISSLFFVHIL